jgi:hypothetical protein
MFADKLAIPWITGVDGYTGVSHQCLRASGRNFKERSGFFDHLVPHVIKLADCRGRDDLFVR